MAIDPAQIVPPDDTGSDTFARYRYQAAFAFPFCLDCALGKSIDSVVFEHVEDLVLEQDKRWRFIQIKTRDPGSDRWTLTDLLADRGALRSLFRSYQAVGDLDCTFEAYLEGAAKRRDDIEHLIDAARPVPAETLQRIAARLGCEVSECEAFLARVHIYAEAPLRQHVDDVNIRLLASEFPKAAAELLEDAHTRMRTRIEQAIAAERLGDHWPEIVVGRRRGPEDVFAAKQLKRASFEPLLAGLRKTEHVAQLASEAETSFGASVRAASDRARESLRPHVLPRVARSRLLDRYGQAIERGVLHEYPRIIPIVGDAGSGKSTLLGDLYDHFRAALTGFVGLVRCDDVILDSHDGAIVDLRFGEALSDQPRQLLSLIASLSSGTRGLLLIDTLDLILDRRMMPTLFRLFRSIVEAGVTLVFTCRGHEYIEFFERQAALAGLAEIVDRHTVPPFTPEEAFAAAEAFLKTNPRITAAEASAFAERITRLSVDRRPIREITQNPLLLAILCELHGDDRVVPADLTVSALYDRYWAAKIAGSRRHNRRSAAVLAKVDICLQLARTAFHRSQVRLIQDVSQDDLRLPPQEPIADGLNDLLSDGVLVALTRERLRFFHQTLLEYAIARWLASVDGVQARNDLLDTLSRSDHATHWWPVVRQLLTIADGEAYDLFSSRLTLNELAPFRAIALSSAARDDLPPFTRLTMTALANGTQHELTLCEALEAASVRHPDRVLASACELIVHGTSQGAVRAGILLGLLVHLHPTNALIIVSKVFEAAARRPKESGKSVDIHAVTLFLQGAESALRAHSDAALFELLRQHYNELGTEGKLAIWRIHAADGTNVGEMRTLLAHTMQQDLEIELQQEVGRLCANFLSGAEPGLGKLEPRSDGPTFLDSWLPFGWSVVQGHMFARLSANDPTVIRRLVDDAIHGSDYMFEVASHAIGLVARERPELADILLAFPLDQASRTQLQRIAALIRKSFHDWNDDQRSRVLDWLKPAAAGSPADLLPVLARLASSRESLGPILDLMDALDPGRQSERLLKLMRALPSERINQARDLLEARVRGLPRGAQRDLAFVVLLGARADTSIEARQELLRLAEQQSRRVRNAASAALADVFAVSSDADPSDLMPLALSTTESVRANCVGVFTRRLQQDFSVSVAAVDALCVALAEEEDPFVLRQLCALAMQWARKRSTLPAGLRNVLDLVATRVDSDDATREGVARTYLLALKAVAQAEDRLSLPLIATLALRFMAAVSSPRIHEREVIELLSAITRLDRTFPQTVLALGPSIKPRNVRAVAMAIKRIDGPSSPLLDKLLASQWCPPATRRAILEARG